MDMNTAPRHGHPTPWLRRLIWPLLVLVLLGVFAMYTQPEFMMHMANQVWSCF